MNRQIIIRRMLAIIMIAGLVLAPLSRPVMASDASMSAMAADMSMSEVADEMADEMPCCPTKAAIPIDCDKCVLMAACMAKCFAGLPMVALHPPFDVLHQIISRPNDPRAAGLDHLPPEPPPRNRV